MVPAQVARGAHTRHCGRHRAALQVLLSACLLAAVSLEHHLKPGLPEAVPPTLAKGSEQWCGRTPNTFQRTLEDASAPGVDCLQSTAEFAASCACFSSASAQCIRACDARLKRLPCLLCWGPGIRSGSVCMQEGMAVIHPGAVMCPDSLESTGRPVSLASGRESQTSLRCSAPVRSDVRKSLQMC